jgi:hypothetical protein
VRNEKKKQKHSSVCVHEFEAVRIYKIIQARLSKIFLGVTVTKLSGSLMPTQSLGLKRVRKGEKEVGRKKIERLAIFKAGSSFGRCFRDCQGQVSSRQAVVKEGDNRINFYTFKPHHKACNIL